VDCVVVIVMVSSGWEGVGRWVRKPWCIWSCLFMSCVVAGVVAVVSRGRGRVWVWNANALEQEVAEDKSWI
jgi:hypothetical protein